jgi:predicted metal-binding membrane protein
LELTFGRFVSNMARLTGAAQRNGFAVLLGLIVVGWFLILWSAANMSSPLVSLTMPMSAKWSLAEVVAVSLMWAVMMGAMMMPSAIPMLTVHRRIAARKNAGSASSNRWFLVGYLCTWAMFSVVAAVIQWAFQRADLLSHMLRLQTPLASGSILLAAGVFQFTPLKAVCLRRCRTPLGFLITDWRPGRAGAFTMGLKHGTYCVGCCWALMLILFVGGVMSLATIAALSTFVFLEKLMPRGDLLARIGGGALIALGLALMFSDGVGNLPFG